MHGLWFQKLEPVPPTSRFHVHPGSILVSPQSLRQDSGISTEDFVAQLMAQLQEPLSIVSRLDYPTSGVLPLAIGEDSPADHWVRAQFAGRLVRKEYLCLCEGPSLGEVGTRGWMPWLLLYVFVYFELFSQSKSVWMWKMYCWSIQAVRFCTTA